MPTTTITLPFNRTKGSVTQAVLGTNITTVTTTQTTNGGFFTNPMKLPVSADLSRPIDLVVDIYSTSVVPPAVGNIVLECATTITPPGSGPGELSANTTFTSPSGWPRFELARVPLLAGGANTYAGGTFTVDDAVGIGIQRLGANAGDTFAGTSGLILAVYLTYFVRCQRICCP